MIEAEPGTDTPQSPRRPGERLQDARVAQGLAIGDVAARTRIPQRHLESIEAGNYSDLPSTTYAVGFARAYARAVGVDEVAMAAEVRAEVDRKWDRPVRTTPAYEVEDPSRTPSRGAVWGGVAVALVLLVGLILFYGTNLFRGGSTPEATADQGVAVAIPQTVAPAPTPTQGSGQVAITATDEVWVRISAGDNDTLLLKTMTPGERFEIPANARDPKIEAGRPDKLAITVNGSAVPPLGDGRRAIKNVSLSAASLLGRGEASTPAATATSAATPAARPTSSAPARASAPAPQSAPTPAAAVPRAFEPAFGNSAIPQ